MTGTYVTDITHFLDDAGELVAEMPSPARKLACFLVLIIDAVTDQANAIFRALRCEKDFELFKDAGHDSCLKADPKGWRHAIEAFLRDRT